MSLFSRNLLARCFSPRARQLAKAPSRRLPLRLEALEDRLVPTAFAVSTPLDRGRPIARLENIGATIVREENFRGVKARR